MRIAYFDCFSGASGDMILGGLVSAGLSPETLRAELAKLPVQEYTLDIRDVKKQGFAAIKVDVAITEKPKHRHLSTILKIINDANLPPRVKDLAGKTFTRLAEAEAKVHGTTPEAVHFHEVGAVDAIVDIVGAMIGIEQLGIDQVVCAPIPTGYGTVTCDHGVMPIPAPATAELLTGVPLAESDEPGELTTPTGAAILTTLAEHFGAMPAMTIDRIGYGAGTRDGRRRANVLRVLIGEAAPTTKTTSLQAGSPEAQDADEVVVLETNLDDATGQQIGYTFEALFAAGALDVFTTPITMKKNRPGVLLTVLAPFERQRSCEEVLFAETPTFGIRRYTCTRRKLIRSFEPVTTRYGIIQMKVGRDGASHVIAVPEYEDCARSAREHGVSLAEVVQEARRVWLAQDKV